MNNVKKFWCHEDLIRYKHPIFTEECEIITKILYEENKIKLYGILTTYDDYFDKIYVYHKNVQYYRPTDFPEDLMEKLKKRINAGYSSFIEDEETLVNTCNCFVFYYKITKDGNNYYGCRYFDWNTFKTNSLNDVKLVVTNWCKDIIKKDLPVIEKYPTQYPINKYDNNIRSMGFTVDLVQEEIDEIRKISDNDNEEINDKLKMLNDIKKKNEEELNMLKEKKNKIRKELEAEMFEK